MCSEPAPGTYPECRHTIHGTEYRGKVHHTWNEKTCYPWKNAFLGAYHFPDATIDESLNYCRNPDNDTYGPWCFHEDNNKQLVGTYCMIPICDTDSYQECKSTRKGTEYQGKISKTWDGQICYPWILVPDTSKYDFHMSSTHGALNYCRNINNHKYGPWCYVQNDIGRLTIKNCQIPYCGNVNLNTSECISTHPGFNYAGTISITTHGYVCQSWIYQKILRNTIGIQDYKFPENNVTLAKNYCRNPDSDTRGTWCYTRNTTKGFDYCLIPMCSEPAAGTYPECRNTVLGTEYRGKMNHAWNGKKCYPWAFMDINVIKKLKFPDATIYESLNYCRNPDNSTRGPWCLYLNDKSQIEKMYCVIPMCIVNAFEECKSTRKGLEYQGMVSTSWNGMFCIPWFVIAGISNEDFPDSSKGAALNYCRNIDDDKSGPWCYVYETNDEVKPRSCNIPYCSSVTLDRKECKSTYVGFDYAGTASKTLSGEKCQPWSEVSELTHFHFPDNNVSHAKNFCRNPNNANHGPWCYTNTTSHETMSCSIPLCEEEDPGCKANLRGSNYKGNASKTLHGKRCLPWVFIKSNTSKYVFPDESIDDALNHCRNPNNRTYGPWCFYKTSPFTRAYCGIPICGISDSLNKAYVNNNMNPAIKTLIWKISEKIALVMYIIIILFGLIFNSLSIAVFATKELRKNSTSLLLIMLAIMDGLSLLLALPDWLRKVGSWYLEAGSDVSCQVYTYFKRVILTSTGWIIVIVISERYVAIAKPHKVKEICTRKNFGVALLVMFICLLLLNIPVLLDMESTSYIIFDEDEIHFGLQFVCGIGDPVALWIDAVIRSFLPFILMLFGNICIIYCLDKSNKIRQEMLSEDQIREDNEQLHSMTISLLAAGFTYLLLTLPYIVYFFYNNTRLLEGYQISNDDIAENQLFWVCANTFVLLNNSINFIIYCLAGKTFNKQFQIMCGCQKKEDPRQKVIRAALAERKRRLDAKEQREMKTLQDLQSIDKAIKADHKKLNAGRQYQDEMHHIRESGEPNNEVHFVEVHSDVKQNILLNEIREDGNDVKVDDDDNLKSEKTSSNINMCKDGRDGDQANTYL